MSALVVSALLPAALIVHALAIVGTVATCRRVRWCRRLTFGGSAIASVLMTAAASFVLASRQPLAGVLFAHAASGLVVDYVVTPLSAWFLIVLGAVGIPVALYSIGYLAHAVDAPGVEGQRINIGWDRPVSMQEIAQIAGRLIGDEITVGTISITPTRNAAASEGGSDARTNDMTAMMQWFESGRYVANTARQREVFGQVPTAEDAIARFLRSLGHTVSTSPAWRREPLVDGTDGRAHVGW